MLSAGRLDQLAKFVVEALVGKIALLVGDPLLQAEMRLDDEFAHRVLLRPRRCLDIRVSRDDDSAIPNWNGTFAAKKWEPLPGPTSAHESLTGMAGLAGMIRIAPMHEDRIFLRQVPCNERYLALYKDLKIGTAMTDSTNQIQLKKGALEL